MPPCWRVDADFKYKRLGQYSSSTESPMTAEDEQQEAFLSQARQSPCVKLMSCSLNLHSQLASTQYYYLLKSYPVKITAPLHLFLYSDAFSLLRHQPYDTLLPAKWKNQI